MPVIFVLPPQTKSKWMKKERCPCRNHNKAEYPEMIPLFFYTSVVTFALGFVTLTPSCFALAMMSMRFLDETLWAILATRQTEMC